MLKLSLLNRRIIAALMAASALAFVYATYKVIDNIVAEQSRIQQQAVSPVYKLVRDELLRPLYIAETFASSIDLTTAIDSGNFDEATLIRQLERMQQDLGLIFFVASEQTRKQYFSTGRTLDLIEGEVYWYFEAKARDKDFMADLGQVGDVHLFYDVKIRGANGEFLGYVGVGKRIQQFLDTFDTYKSRYGFDFVFANENDEILLSSLPDLVVTDAYIPTLDTLDWFAHGNSDQHIHDSEIIEVDEADFLISEFRIEELGWRLLLLVPLEARQAQITRAFLSNAFFALSILVVLAGLFLFLMLVYKRNLEKSTETDPLTGLPNRAYVQRRFAQLRRSGAELCAIIIDLDHFKSINDTYGHDAGDRALEAAADVLRQELREKDAVSRWGGEEFVMLIPATSIEMGTAIAERSRQNLERLTIDTRHARLSLTASFGVAFGCAADETLAELLSRADKALYLAKQNGRNQVRLDQAA
ncbi:MAG: sensor domain-containing diguanylate cyclase [Pseudomonadota bacterium]